MEKKYKEQQEVGCGRVEEPEMTYNVDHIFPALSKEELEDTITGEELREQMRNYIHKLFNQ